MDPSVRWPIYDYVSYFDAIIRVLEDEGWIPGFNCESPCEDSESEDIWKFMRTITKYFEILRR